MPPFRKPKHFPLSLPYKRRKEDDANPELKDTDFNLAENLPVIKK